MGLHKGSIVLPGSGLAYDTCNLSGFAFQHACFVFWVSYTEAQAALVGKVHTP